jgi:hypothetical protein
MSEFDGGANAPAPTQDIVEGADQNLPEHQEADASPAPESIAESDEQKAARIVAERQVRERRERNKEAAARRVLENERDTYRKFAETMVDALKKGQAAPTPPANNAPKAPTRDLNPDTGRPFDSYEDYVEARAAFAAEKRASDLFERKMAEAAIESQNRQREQTSRQVMDAHIRRNSDFARTVPDFEEVTNRDDIDIPAAAVEAIKRLNNGPAVLYAMGRDESIAKNLKRMEPLEQVVYMGQLSHWLATSTPHISNAAPPGRTVGSKPASSGSPPSDPEAYMAWANKKFGRR